MSLSLFATTLSSCVFATSCYIVHGSDQREGVPPPPHCNRTITYDSHKVTKCDFVIIISWEVNLASLTCYFCIMMYERESRCKTFDTIAVGFSSSVYHPLHVHNT